ncbi:iron-containing redox enzyme family protein [Altererythrobacter sp. TH136]|uniref:iron-containing redox enzyme family protein n=1 Tax=Altererythrobacter sp. TH136 TaxID=2067415 RepID=UPI001164D6EA|nr:iron-containing redox enzyme family protein [Altererythrobacter sp. TH136]QDM41579.1 iron-containing redox enzyme family protein [Altererythrobacter sp. TH136]
MATRATDYRVRRDSQFLTDSFQRGLAHWNRQRLEPGLPQDDWRETAERDHRMQRLEGAFIEELRAEVRAEAASAPTDAEDFIDWFENLKQVGPGQGDPLFPWLAEHADKDQLRWFFEQEAAGEAGFDDLVALTQVKLPTRPKLELARNYWDEMGHGTVKGMHGPMLDALVETLQVDPTIENTVWESLALANAMTAMAVNRRYAWLSVGALGVVELTAPGRSALVANALKRVGLTPKEARYFTLHAVLDVKHSEEWNKEAIRPAVEEDPRRATAMAEGALIRLKCGERCFDAYRERLWG